MDRCDHNCCCDRIIVILVPFRASKSHSENQTRRLVHRCSPTSDIRHQPKCVWLHLPLSSVTVGLCDGLFHPLPWTDGRTVSLAALEDSGHEGCCVGSGSITWSRPCCCHWRVCSTYPPSTTTISISTASPETCDSPCPPCLLCNKVWTTSRTCHRQYFLGRRQSSLNPLLQTSRPPPPPPHSHTTPRLLPLPTFGSSLSCKSGTIV